MAVTVPIAANMLASGTADDESQLKTKLQAYGIPFR